MSAKYQDPRHVPLEKLTERLGELADAITRGGESMDRELTMRIPAECDRDADLVIGEAASRLTSLQSEVERLIDAGLKLSEFASQLHYSKRDKWYELRAPFIEAQRLRQQAAESEQ